MKGIILAGGSGTRLHPLTLVTSKQLLPVFDKPLIYYPLSTLISLGVKDILLISSPTQLDSFKLLLEDGDKYGVNISYEVQLEPKGIAEALIIGENFINGDACALILGDNIFISDIFTPELSAVFHSGATVFTSHVEDPERYGVIEIQDDLPIQITEKPEKFISNLAVTGLYFYDSEAVECCKSLRPSARNELEITELNKIYLEKRKLNVINLSEASIWMDAGTFDSLQDASNCISSLQNRLGVLIGSPEYAAFKLGLLTQTKLNKDIDASLKNSYYLTLQKLVNFSS